MSKWIRGRLGRPMTSMLIGLLLVSLILPLAPHPVQAQFDTKDVVSAFKMFSKEITEPTPVVVFDYVNKSGYNTGMLGRTFADALTIELINTKTFDVVKRSLVEQVLSDANMTIPLSWQAQSMVADRLSTNPDKRVNFSITGEIENVKIAKGRQGTYAEVTISTLVISRVTKAPINGARVTQKSSPKIGYGGNTDVLVHEALATAAYQCAQTLLDNRLPVGTVLQTPRNNEVEIRGGSSVGFKPGMLVTTIRRETVTGKMRVLSVTPADSLCEVLDESKGIAPGDKVIPIFELGAPRIFTEEAQRRTGMQLAAVGALALLGVVVGTQGGDRHLNATETPTAYPLADAESQGYYSGANLVRWPYMGGRVLAYVIYRDTNAVAPIAVVAGDTTSYIDSATMLEQGYALESDAVNIEIDEANGILDAFDHDVVYEPDLLTWNSPNETFDDTSYSVDTKRVPISPGMTSGYLVKTVYIAAQRPDIDEEIGLPDQYRIMVGLKSAISNRVTCMQPPTLNSPVDQLPLDGNYICERVPRATTYTLQLSTTASFTRGTTVTVPAYITSDTYATAHFSVSDLYKAFPVAGSIDQQTIYWRMGGRVDGQALPAPVADPNTADWVYSTIRSFTMLKTPPAPFKMRSQGLFNHGLPNKTGVDGRGEREGRGGALRR